MYILLGRMADWQARLATANKERLAMQLLGTKIVRAAVLAAWHHGTGHCSSATNCMKE